MFALNRCVCVEKINQLDATEWFIAFIIYSKCFGHLYGHHQELETIHVLLPHMARDEGSCSSNFPHPGHIACCPAPDRQPPATKTLHTICDNNTSIVWSSWWWAYKCPKHVEQIISAIKHSVASTWFSSLRVYPNVWLLKLYYGGCWNMVIWLSQLPRVSA